MIYFTRSHERTIFFSSHLLDDVERVADHVAVLDYSVLRSCCSVDAFRDHVRQFSVRLLPSRSPLTNEKNKSNLPPIPGLLRAARDQDELILIVANADDHTRRIIDSLGPASVQEQPIGLEDALIAYVGRHGKRSLLLSKFGGAR